MYIGWGESISLYVPWGNWEINSESQNILFDQYLYSWNHIKTETASRGKAFRAHAQVKCSCVNASAGSVAFCGRREGLHTQNSRDLPIVRSFMGLIAPAKSCGTTFCFIFLFMVIELRGTIFRMRSHFDSGVSDTFSYKRLRYIRLVLAQALNGLLSVTRYYL